MYGPKYVWILFSGRFQDNWWKVQSPLVDCTPEEVRKGLSNNIGTAELKLSPVSGPTKFGKVCNITPSQIVVSPLTRGDAREKHVQCIADDKPSKPDFFK